MLVGAGMHAVCGAACSGRSCIKLRRGLVMGRLRVASRNRAGQLGCNAVILGSLQTRANLLLTAAASWCSIH